MRRSGLRQVICSVGEALPFASATFATAVIGWVLHHDAPDLDAMGIVREAARVVGPGGRLLSVEPLDGRFDVDKWMRLLHSAGFAVEGVQEFFQMPIITTVSITATWKRQPCSARSSRSASSRCRRNRDS